MLAAVAGATTHQVFGDYSVDLSLDRKDSSYAIITVTMMKGTWVGLALGSTGMASGTDMIAIDGDA